MTRPLALLLSVTVTAAGCATTPDPKTRPVPQIASAAESDLMREYLASLPAGTRLRAILYDGQVVRGTVMKVTGTELVLQKRTRVPEPPVAVPIDRIRSAEPETNMSTGRVVAIGVAVGAGV
ncbi:MAG TPA: hypothetical protein VLD67_15015, partial [Vicinamibacterales bacterium]|nr:hypothetical protein [Vicinamibacterales bacterium]